MYFPVKKVLNKKKSTFHLNFNNMFVFLNSHISYELIFNKKFTQRKIINMFELININVMYYTKKNNIFNEQKNVCLIQKVSIFFLIKN